MATIQKVDKQSQKNGIEKFKCEIIHLQYDKMLTRPPNFIFLIKLGSDRSCMLMRFWALQMRITWHLVLIKIAFAIALSSLSPYTHIIMSLFQFLTYMQQSESQVERNI